MRYFVRNLHVFVFAFVSLLAAVVVASDQGQTRSLLRPVVEDAVELQELARAGYSVFRKTDPLTVGEKAVQLYVTTLKMPSKLFERIAEKLEAAKRQMDIKGHGPTPVDRPAPLLPIEMLPEISRHLK